MILPKRVKISWRRQLIICVSLGLLAIPVYFVDRLLLGPQAGSGNWITLDFRGVIFWTYIVLIAIQITVSSIAVLFFPKSGVLRIHLGSAVLSLILFATGIASYGKLRRLAVTHQYRALMESRKSLITVIELKRWWYLPDENNPTEIRVSVVVHQRGRFAGNVTGAKTDASGGSTTVFESANEPGNQRQVIGGESFTYGLPLKFVSNGRADDVRITLYLFKSSMGPGVSDIAKVFVNSPQRADDGEYFYGVLPPASQPAE